MTATVTTNGRARRSLEAQLDRFDSILDGLAEALNGAVAEAVKEAVGVAVQEAVKAVLTEVMTNPELARVVAPKVATEEKEIAAEKPRRPSLLRRAWNWISEKARNARNYVRRKVSTGWAATVARLAAALGAAGMVTRLARTSPAITAKACGVGLLVGVACYVCGPVIASVVCGVCGVIAAAAYPVVMPLWRMMRMTEETD